MAELLEPRLMCSVSVAPQPIEALPPEPMAPSLGALQKTWPSLGPAVRLVDDAPNSVIWQSPAIALDDNGYGTRNGTLERQGDKDVFRVNIAASGRFQFDAIAGTMANPYLRLLDSRGTALASDDNSGDGYNSRIVRNMAAGTYYLQLSATNSLLTGTYQASVTKVGEFNAAPTVAASATAAPSTVTGTTTVLAACGADDNGEANLNYRWVATTLPAGASAPTFSANGANAAKNTTVTFAKAGSYAFTVTITDAGGLSTTSSVNVTVAQTLTSIVVTPGNVSLNAGGTQQFVAKAKDQFALDMSSQPTMTWSATAGSISTSGLYTAPGTATTAAITATAGALAGAASVTVTGSQGGLQDAELASLFQTLIVDTSIDRNDMMQLLRSAGNDNGVVDAAELTDLKYILTNAATYKIPGYVQVLAGNVVNGNQANACYQGTSLGNLAAGSPGDSMTKLVDKWFLGADHPAADYAYKSFAGALFVNGPAYNDSDQGYLGDCYFIASLDAIARSSPAAIQNMFIDNGDNTWTVRYYYNGTPDYVTVDRYLPSSYNYSIYADVRGTYTNAGNELWMALAEKAYAQWNETGKEGRDGQNSYPSIEGGWMHTVCQQVLGHASQMYWGLYDADKQALVLALAANKAVTYGTKSSPGDGLVGPHAYMVQSYNSTTDTFQLYNPWGSSHPGALTYAQLRTNGQCFVVADASGSTPFGSTPGLTAPLASASSTPSSDEESVGDAPVAYVDLSTAEAARSLVFDRVFSAGLDVTDGDFNALFLTSGRRVKTSATGCAQAADTLFARHDALHA